MFYSHYENINLNLQAPSRDYMHLVAILIWREFSSLSNKIQEHLRNRLVFLLFFVALSVIVETNED